MAVGVNVCVSGDGVKNTRHSHLLFGLDDEQARLLPLRNGVLDSLQPDVAGVLAHVAPGKGSLSDQNSGDLSLHICCCFFS